MKKLTEKEKLFLSLYTDPNNKETFGNATQSYKKAYGASSDAVASELGSRKLRKVEIKKFMQEKTKEFELDTDKHVLMLSEMITDLMDKAKTKGSLTVAELEKLTKPIRFFAEYAGRVGSGGNQTNIYLPDGKTCKYCGHSTATFDITQLKTIPSRYPGSQAQVITDTVEQEKIEHAAPR